MSQVTIDEFRKSLQELVDQVHKSNAIDDHGHRLNMLKALHDADIVLARDRAHNSIVSIRRGDGNGNHGGGNVTTYNVRYKVTGNGAYEHIEANGQQFSRLLIYSNPSPNAKLLFKLFTIKGVQEVWASKPYSVTIDKAPVFTWEEIDEQVIAMLQRGEEILAGE